MKTFWTNLGGRRAEFVGLLGVSSLVSAAEALLHPLMLKWLFDEAVIVQDFQRFLWLSLGYLALGLAVVGLFYATSLWQRALANRVVLDLEMGLLEQSLVLDWRAFNRQGSGSFVSRIHKDTFEGFVPAVSLALTFVQQALATSVFLAVLLYLSWKATLALILLAPPLIWAARRMGGRVRQATSEEREREARFVDVLTDSLKAFRILRAVPHLRPPTLGANRAALRAYLVGTYDNFRLLTLQRTWSDSLRNGADAISLAVGGYYALVGELTFGGYVAFVNAFWRAVGNAFALLQRLPEWQRYQEVLRRIGELMSVKPSSYARPSPAVRLRDVQLSYDGKGVLDVPHLEVRTGERLLLIGPNGAGKTSLLHVLAGYLAPDRGEVALPERVAALTAPVELPPLTVRQMVTDPWCLRALGLDEVRDQPAHTLSAGQRQRTAVGALLSQEADLYVLDEPLANLDSESKEAVLELIFERTRGKALVVVLHGDEELHERFDRLVALSGGTLETVRDGPSPGLQRPQPSAS